MKPVALDLFCGAGGVSMGLHRAGFDVVGVDVTYQPRYPFQFINTDALGPDITYEFLRRFDLIWASPPCQAHTDLKTMHNAKKHIDLIPPTRRLLQSSGRPWVVENVPGSPLEFSILLCGTMFGLGCRDAELRRHRLFETSRMLLAPTCQHGDRPVIGLYGGHQRNRKRFISIYGEGCRESTRKHDKGHPDFTVEDGRAAMGIDWMTLAELCQAIPPAYAEFIGRQFLAEC
jgi:DNA (cytosine-5)-methyltransferase 1